MSGKLFLGKYIKLQYIGKGAFASVYKVRHAELGDVRAVKVLNDYIESKDDKAYQQLLNEYKILKAIDSGYHPNIVRTYGVELIDNRVVIEQDCIQGSTVAEFLKRHNGFVEYAEVRKFIHDIVGALAYMHHDIYKFLMAPEDDMAANEKELVKKYGIVHNDLHSNNVMRNSYDGRYILLGFGIAIQYGACVKTDRCEDGAPEYMAPEKCEGDEITPRSDVYSLGILMYEMLAGRVPFELELTADGYALQGSLMKVMDQHRDAQPEPIIDLRREAFNRVHPGVDYRRDYPEWLDNVIAKCLTKKPADRYADARELLDDINAHMTQEA